MGDCREFEIKFDDTLGMSYDADDICIKLY